MLVAEVQAAMDSLLKSAGFDGAAQGVATLRATVRDLVALGELDDASGRRLEERLYASARALLQGRPCRGAVALEAFRRIVRGLNQSGNLSQADASSLLEEGGELEATIAQRIRA